MKLSQKITLLVFLFVSLFIAVTAAYLWREMNRAYHQQTARQIKLTRQLIEAHLESEKKNLAQEIERLKAFIFREDEEILASMLKTPPDFTPAVIAFADKLRTRTNLDFLTLISSDGVILSSSREPASYGSADPAKTFPIDEAIFTIDSMGKDPLIEFRAKAAFAQRAIFLHGGYFLSRRVHGLPVEHIEVLSDTESRKDPQDHLQIVELPILSPQGAVLTKIQFGISTIEFARQRDTLKRSSTIFLVLALIISLLTGYMLSLWISRPLEQLNDAAISMALGNLSARVEDTGTGEIGELITAFNSMAEQLEENQRKLIQTERIAAWQEIAKHIAHEIKNPLTPIRTSIINLQLSMEKAPEKLQEIFPEATESILEEVEKLRELADQFSRFARLPPPDLREGNLNDVIQKCMLLYRDHGPAKIEFTPGKMPVMKFDSNQITEVIHNLLQNSLDAIGNEGRIVLQTGTGQSGHRIEGYLIVEDNGVGIDPAVRDRIFIPYFTTKVKGTGLGLAIVQRIISEHGGRVVVKSSPGVGTRFEIHLPAS